METPSFSKFTTLHLYPRPRLVPVCANQKKFKEDFHFDEKKGKKQKECSTFVLQGGLKRGSEHPRQRVAPPSAFPGNCAWGSIQLPVL